MRGKRARISEDEQGGGFIEEAAQAFHRGVYYYPSRSQAGGKERGCQIKECWTMYIMAFRPYGQPSYRRCGQMDSYVQEELEMIFQWKYWSFIIAS